MTIDSEPTQPEYSIGEPLTWGATPLLSWHGETAIQQAGVHEALLQRAEYAAPDTLPDEIKNFILTLITSRFSDRAQLNYESYAEKLVKDDNGLSPSIINMLRLAEIGKASPVQLLEVFHAYKFGSIELARLTHPHGSSVEYLSAMRGAVAEAVVQCGGVEAILRVAPG